MLVSRWMKQVKIYPETLVKFVSMMLWLKDLKEFLLDILTLLILTNRWRRIAKNVKVVACTVLALCFHLEAVLYLRKNL